MPLTKEIPADNSMNNAMKSITTPTYPQNHVYSHRNQDFGWRKRFIRVSIFSFRLKTSSLQSA